jgi:hypothetical protein
MGACLFALTFFRHVIIDDPGTMENLKMCLKKPSLKIQVCSQSHLWLCSQVPVLAMTRYRRGHNRLTPLWAENTPVPRHVCIVQATSWRSHGALYMGRAGSGQQGNLKAGRMG